ncbi:hypothetical protein Q3G72_027099 [Acer saccharum]|nr:hypothetical protein Q3G72_027099 [Acer saccharum]
MSRILREMGVLLVKDSRCTVEDNDRFIDMMEKYFKSPPEFKRLQERPNFHYQKSFSTSLLLAHERQGLRKIPCLAYER